MAQIDRNPEFSTPTTREQQQAAYWRTRTQAKLDQLEREARRMFQLEEELSHFANQYYDAVGEVTQRLAQVEDKLAAENATSTTPDTTVAALPELMAHRDASQSRRGEVKARYRSLAKEIHPDRAMMVSGTGDVAATMHALNAAYQHGDLAALLKIEAQMLLTHIPETQTGASAELENALRDIERAADTYAQGYRALLNSPLNELMLRAMSARLAGWDWMQAVVRKVERTIEEKERAAVVANIAQIGAWRSEVQESVA